MSNDETSLPVLMTLRPVRPEDMQHLLHIENQCYSHPWTLGNFEDSVRSGYDVQTLLVNDDVCAYRVSMNVLDEIHLLNLAVHPAHQGQGCARYLLDDLCQWGIAQGKTSVWLEVRPSNHRARLMYERYGFQLVGRRKNYYPLTATQREDALIMNFPLTPLFMSQVPT